MSILKKIKYKVFTCLVFAVAQVVTVWLSMGLVHLVLLSVPLLTLLGIVLLTDWKPETGENAVIKNINLKSTEKEVMYKKA